MVIGGVEGLGLSKVRFVRTGSCGWLIRAGWREEPLVDVGSAHRGSDTAQAHDLYAKAQSSHVLIGEYRSLPHARVSRAIVKFVMVDRRGSEIEEGRLEDV